MNKRFVVRYTDRENDFERDLPTREEAEEFAMEMFNEGYAVSPHINEIRE